MRILWVFFGLLCGLPASSQEDEKINGAIETITENTSPEDDLSELSEQLSLFIKHPVNLNKTTPEELKKLLFLSQLQIRNFFEYTAKNKLLDVLELQTIPGFDTETVNKILPFVTTIPTANYRQLKWRELLYSANHDLILRYGNVIQQRKGFKDLSGSRYLGSADQLLFRYRYNLNQTVSAALVMEKDAGERLYNSAKGPDYLSAHLAFFKPGSIAKFIIGDYSLRFGQGLTLWSGFAFGKGPDVTSVAAKDVGLKPYTSANEASFLRGITSSIKLGKNIILSNFFSVRKLDASLKTMPDGTFSVSNINISGLHRTQSELNNKKTLAQQIYGAVIQYSNENLDIGLIGYHSHYKHPFTTGTQMYNRYSFTGKTLFNSGIYYNYTFRNIYLYGEIAHSIGSGKALLNGAMASLSPKASLVLLHRSYDKHYHNFVSNAIGEGTETNNENGWYMGFNYRLSGNLHFSLYGDYFRFPWLKYRVDKPSSGYEVFTQLNYTHGKNFKASLRFKQESKEQNPDAGSVNNELHAVVKQNYRLEWSWKINRKFSFRQRSEITQYQKGINRKETGYMVHQDIHYIPLSTKTSANIRIAFFNTPSYNSRIYAYENNVLYAAGSGVYAGKGLRCYINVRYKLFKKIDIWGRYACFVYSDTTTIGSGLDEIEGNIKSELKLQIRLQF